MSKYTASSWRRACTKSAERNVKETEVARLHTKTATLIAREVIVRGQKEYHISLLVEDSEGNIKNGYNIYYNKDEANAKWVVLRRKWFPNL